jgi:hypothetical protein
MCGNGQNDGGATALYVLSYPVYIYHRTFPLTESLDLHLGIQRGAQ